jgi:predicted HTH domain antitoxin
MQLTVEIPDDFYLNYEDAEQFKKELTLNNAMILFMQGKITISLAAELSGINLYDFMHHCKKNNIPVYNLSAKDLDVEIEELKNSK